MEKTELPMVANFDDLRRCQDILTDGTAEIEFRRFLQIVHESRLHWQATTAEAQRLQRELDKLQLKFDECSQERSDFETKLFHARRLLESESKARRQLEEKLSKVCDYLHTDRELNHDIRSTLASLNVSSHKRKPKSNRYDEQRNCNEINSTCSFLSELSMTHLEDDFLDVSRPFKKHRPSNITSNVSYVETNERRRSARKTMDLQRNGSVYDLDGSEKIVATTKITIPQDDGPIEATSTIETVPLAQFDQFDRIDAEEQQSYNNAEQMDEDDKKSESSVTTVLSLSSRYKKQNAPPIPSAPSLQEIMNDPKPVFNFQMRQHDFSSRTVLRSESCAYCLKKFRFGSSALKCRACSTYLHQDCKIQFAMACIPKSQGKSHWKQGYIADYVPAESPMIPPLIVHCINEVESRGLSEKGIYRVSGSEKEIKGLKERILRGKSAPMLSNTDIHVICGCIKDFLRGLKEPLIPTNLWKTFSNAVQMIDDRKVERELFTAIGQLPQANRDTLAYLVLHLQRVANSKAVQMPIDNLAKVFGPTVLGYSCADPDHHAILSETMVQKDVMENLLKISTEYWTRFINTDSSTDSTVSTYYSFFGTPNAKIANNTFRKERKFFTTPPYSSRR